MEIIESLGQEVFLVGLDGALESGDLTIFPTLDSLEEHIAELSPAVETNLVVLHGVLATAECIPDRSYRLFGGPYIIVLSPSEVDTGCIYETDSDVSSKILAEKIEGILESEADGEFEGLSIENILILYGYELDLGFRIQSDSVDEERIEACRDLAKCANDMKEARNDEKEESGD